MYKKKGNPAFFLQLKILQILFLSLDLLILHKCSKRKKAVKQSAGPLKIAIPFDLFVSCLSGPGVCEESATEGGISCHFFPLNMRSLFL